MNKVIDFNLYAKLYFPFNIFKIKSYYTYMYDIFNLLLYISFCYIFQYDMTNYARIYIISPTMVLKYEGYF